MTLKEKIEALKAKMCHERDTFAGHYNEAIDDVIKLLEEHLQVNDEAIKQLILDALMDQYYYGGTSLYQMYACSILNRLRPYLSPASAQPTVSAEVAAKGEMMVQALRTIASGKKDYGRDIRDTDYSECREIAKAALIALQEKK